MTRDHVFILVRIIFHYLCLTFSDTIFYSSLPSPPISVSLSLCTLLWYVCRSFAVFILPSLT